MRKQKIFGCDVTYEEKYVNPQDPTQLETWTITKNDLTIKVEQFFGDYSVYMPEYAKYSGRDRIVLHNVQQASELLTSIRFPSLQKIISEIDRRARSEEREMDAAMGDWSP